MNTRRGGLGVVHTTSEVLRKSFLLLHGLTPQPGSPILWRLLGSISRLSFPTEDSLQSHTFSLGFDCGIYLLKIGPLYLVGWVGCWELVGLGIYVYSFYFVYLSPNNGGILCQQTQSKTFG